MEPREVVERYLGEALCGDEPEAVAELVSSEELRRRTQHLRGAFPDLVVELLALLVDGPRVAAHFVARATHSGVFQGVPPTGRTCEAHCTAIYHVADGRIAEAWTTWDSLSLLEQLGAIERVRTVSA
jgi:steroid delta-isomerase-like uncharacterized protein